MFYNYYDTNSAACSHLPDRFSVYWQLGDSNSSLSFLQCLLQNRVSAHIYDMQLNFDLKLVFKMF